MHTALLSAYSKDDKLRGFAADLISMGWKLLASSGTKKFLDECGIPATDVADIAGEPILGHRVVTLDRKIHAAIMARRDNPDDMAELKRLGVDPIQMVYVDLYPLVQELEDPNCTFQSIIEKTDIGGPTLLRAAAKGHCFVISDPNQFCSVMDFLRSPPDPRDPNGLVKGNMFLSQLAADAELKVAAYAALSAAFYHSVIDGEFPSKWHKPRSELTEEGDQDRAALRA